MTQYAGFCHHCGAKSATDCSVCPTCGGQKTLDKTAVLLGALVPPKKNNELRTYLIWLAIILLVFFACAEYIPQIINRSQGNSFSSTPSSTSPVATDTFVGRWVPDKSDQTIVMTINSDGSGYIGSDPLTWTANSNGFDAEYTTYIEWGKKGKVKISCEYLVDSDRLLVTSGGSQGILVRLK